MNKKKMIIITSVILFIVLISLGILKLYNTYALSSYIDTSSNATYQITVKDNTTVTIPANSTKNVFYMISNTTSGTVNYGVAYKTTSGIVIKYYANIGDTAKGLIEENGKKYVKLRITNSNSTAKNVEISTILGYSGDSNLIVPSEYTLVKDSYSITLTDYITNLYTNDEKDSVTNNDINYNYATSVSLMNDRLGSSTTDINGGNIRYYGATPNNYIYFNCSDYSNQTDSNCEKWRIIGVFNGKIKIIRNSSIGRYSWDNKPSGVGTSISDNGSNNWTDSRLMIALNPTDYSSSFSTDIYAYNKGAYWYSLSTACYFGTNSGFTTCNFTTTGLKNDITRELVSEETYYLGGHNDTSVYSDVIYIKEKTGTKTWNGKVALPYASDYGYAVDFNKCTQNLFSYDNSDCISNNWLESILSASWLLNPYSSYSYGAWNILQAGSVNYTLSTFNVLKIVPTLYLDSSIKINENTGDGSEDNPYQINI